MRLLRQAMRGAIPQTLAEHRRAIAQLERRDQRTPAGWEAQVAALATLQDQMAGLLNPPRCAIRRTTAQSITPSTATSISFDAEVYNTFDLWDSGSPTVITIRRAGIYLVWTQIVFAGSLTGAYVRVRIRRTQADATVSYPVAHVSAAQTEVDHPINVARLVALAPEDALDVRVTHDSSSARNILAASDRSPYFGVWRIGD